jgi:STE24 endopeptidase
MNPTSILLLIIVFIVVEFVWSQIRSALNRSRMSDTLPPELEGIYDPEKYAVQQRYQKENSRFDLIQSSIDTVVIILILVTGLLGAFENYLAGHIANPYYLAITFAIIALTFTALTSLPFEYYETFVIEEKFGFNKSTRALFFKDAIINLVITLIIGCLALAVVMFFYRLNPQWFWVYAWAVLTFISVGIGYFYSQLIVPLFNKQTPLEDGELKDSLLNLAEQTAFPIEGVYHIDGSKRSTKANAYFTGFGKKKRICLYDTLQEQLDTDEITGVLAHEIGHYKKHHIWQGMVLGILMQGFQLYLLSLFLGSPALATALGSKTGQPSLILSIIAFGYLYGPISETLSVIENVISRKNEYQADAYAHQYEYGNPMIEGLKKISSQALSNLTPHPIVVFWTYSHPTLLQRMKALKA